MTTEKLREMQRTMMKLSDRMDALGWASNLESRAVSTELLAVHELAAQLKRMTGEELDNLTE